MTLYNVTFTLAFFLFAFAPDTHAYYSSDLFLPSTQSQPHIFKTRLHQNLSWYHDVKAPEILSKNCPKFKKCFRHTNLGYKTARRYMFGQIHLKSDPLGYFITPLYCDKKLRPTDFPGSNKIGPDQIPDSNILNTEHIWPQSRFSSRFPKKQQKSDLHAIYPANSKINSARGNLPYGEVVSHDKVLCNSSAIGGRGNKKYMEPRPARQGDIARAMFYFSIRYNIAIDPKQEESLLAWHINDPVSEFEIEKNEATYLVQRNRNPFVDHPEWVQLIQDF